MKKFQSVKPGGPWYRHYDYWSILASRYMIAYGKLPDDAKHHSEFEMFSELCAVRLVFESNRIEDSGASYGETRKLVEENFPKIPNDYDLFKRMMSQKGGKEWWEDCDQQVKHMQEVICSVPRRNVSIKPSYRLAGASREAREVLQHYLAVVKAGSITYQHIFSRMAILIADWFRKKCGNEELAVTEWKKNFPDKPLPTSVKPLLVESEIKTLHKIMAKGLMPSDAGVEAGEYRKDTRSVGSDVAFPSHELIPECMAQYFENSNKLIEETKQGANDPLMVAAKISYDFVRIHPFPDFNGRVSRIILKMVLQAFNVPFAVTLRGNKKCRRQYLVALRRANRGDTKPMATLIAIRLVETFQEIDKNLVLAGLNPLVPVS